MACWNCSVIIPSDASIGIQSALRSLSEDLTQIKKQLSAQTPPSGVASQDDITDVRRTLAKVAKSPQYQTWEQVFGSAPRPFCRLLNTNTTPASSVTTGETDLMTYTMKAQTLISDGQILRSVYGGNVANNANAKTLKAYIGASLIVTIGLTVSVATKWLIELFVVRMSSTTQRVYVSRAHNAFIAPGGTDGAADLQTDLVVKLTGTGVATTDITQELAIHELMVQG